MKPALTDNDFQAAAHKLRCEVAAIKAVAEVESRGEAFYADGFPVILFERHKFAKYTNGRYVRTHPHICNWTAGGYGAAGPHQRNKFNEAYKLNPIAAMLSCSWGRFQIMGFNFAICGFPNVGLFVDAMKQSEAAQLNAFVEFILSNNLADELRNREWAAFARLYNGRGYKKNRYDEKLAAAYAKYKRRVPKLADVTPEPEQIDDLLLEIPQTVANQIEQIENLAPAPQKDGAETLPDLSPPAAVNSAPSPPVAEIDLPAPKGFWARIKKKAMVLLPAEIGFQAVVDYGRQIAELPFSPQFWAIMASIGGLFALGWFVTEIYHHLNETVRDSRTLVKEMENATARGAEVRLKPQ